jgi:hypothetical protein
LAVGGLKALELDPAAYALDALLVDFERLVLELPVEARS